jgi:tartrate dehydratase beta subunit/fumarate hydratase class I family protein
MKPIYTVAAAVLLSYSGIHAASSHPTLTTAATSTRAASAATTETAPSARGYAGTIVLLNGSLYILRDDRNQTWYHLDDQEMPAKYWGKKVLITGALDEDANVIHVRDIEPANG